MQNSFYPSLLLLFLLIFSACRGDDEILVSETKHPVAAGGTSFFQLNEGNMGSNKATLDFYDGKLGIYRHNIFPEQNPGVALELGDVGNDIGVYGSKLYAVINVSGLVEVMDARTARHLRAISIPNCRYLCFHAGKAYVSSYAGPIAPGDPAARRGFVARIDTATLTIEATCETGFQPEQMVVANGKLYVANSGGYRAPDYDRTLSVIDLASFTPERSIDVAPNLHFLRLHNNKLYVGSRGNYEEITADIYVVNPTTGNVEERLGIEADAFCFYKETLIALRGGRDGKSVVRYDSNTHSTQDFITDGTLADIQTPYGLAADEQARRIYITDARDYVSPGRLICYDESGKRLWETRAGDIPAHFAFVSDAEINENSKESSNKSKGINKIWKYRPAPGQFVNTLPEYTDGDDEAAMCAKVFAAIGEGRHGLVTLGAAGGYLVAGFATRVPNVQGEFDIEVLGNAFENASEAGIVSVMRDENGNGRPDDTWYELAGNAESEALRNFELTYTHPDDNHKTTAGDAPWCADSRHIAWRDGNGQNGWLAQNIYHLQPYFPRWTSEKELNFSFTLLPNRAYESGGTWLQPAFGMGYADDSPNGTDGCRFDIGNAIDSDGRPIHLDGIDFIRIHTAVFRQMGAIGEASTEVSYIRSLH